MRCGIGVVLLLLGGCTFGVDGSFATSGDRWMHAEEGTLDEGAGLHELTRLRTTGEDEVHVSFRTDAAVREGRVTFLAPYFSGSTPIEVELDGELHPARIEWVDAQIVPFGDDVHTVAIRVERPRAPLELRLTLTTYQAETL